MLFRSWLNGQRHGTATATYEDGATYTGAFVNGRREGQGEMVMADGFKYAGGWKAGKFDGKGIATYVNGDIYEGTFTAGKRQGQGTMRYAATGQESTGNWQNGALAPAGGDDTAAPDAETTEQPADGSSN